LGKKEKSEEGGGRTIVKKEDMKKTHMAKRVHGTPIVKKVMG